MQKRVSIDFRQSKKYSSVDKERIKSEVKRFNTNLRYLAEKYGTDSVVYKSRVDVLEGSIPREYWHENSKGVFQLKVTGEYLSTREGKSALLQTRQKTVSVKQLEKQTRQELGMLPKNASKVEKAKFEQTVIRQTERNLQTDTRLQDLKQFLYKAVDRDEVRENVPELYTEGKKTYEQLEEIIAKMEAQTKTVLDEWADEENPPDFIKRMRRGK